MKDKAYIYLPNGTRFQLENEAPNGVFTEEGTSEILRLFASADGVNLHIIVNGRQIV